MHELGIVVHIIRTVENIAKEHDITAVKQVTLEIGEVSGVLHDYLLSCWKWSMPKTEYLKEAELVIEEIEALTYCESCKQLYRTVEYAKICPYCNSEHTYLHCGNEMNIKELEVY